MNVTVQIEFKADRKEPLGELVRRVAGAFDRAGIEADVIASFGDGPGGIRPVSAVERALKKHPHLASFERNDPPVEGRGIPPVRRLTNRGASKPFPIADLLALADAVPRSLPFHAVSVQFQHSSFGRAAFPPGLAPATGITIGDGWWVNGRLRSLTALYSVEASAASKTLPDPPPAIVAVLAAFGKPKNKAQFVAPEMAAPSEPAQSAPAAPTVNRFALVTPIVTKYRSGLTAMLERIVLPHDLPPAAEAVVTARGATGPLKPALVDAFTPRGFDCSAPDFARPSARFVLASPEALTRTMIASELQLASQTSSTQLATVVRRSAKRRRTSTLPR
jgi:hypothetical protein